ncbi:SUMF1/EgtB/PvdO family nonheme iron enzyme [Polyangium sp. y55x31]|uniref:formylglycine-generating enzyme family protein n=1 Tax=Polyangium sp. y55x31 TaxID=3042688 RepID=UPI002482FAE6|nr:SUMF1/EgtB/PvdO family nonheme iron enzyme [Polyangium sp. y55x31]MDI1477063.1 SUMF1/EgtB/PvdO family nonheme iron enzyme [Polyangium sp. y55x31]
MKIPGNETSVALLCALAALVGCTSGGGGSSKDGADGGPAVVLAPKGKVLEAAENQKDPDAGASKAEAAKSERVDIPDGTLVAGSTPGDKGRDPVLEPAELEVKLGSYAIDRYLYPNDPTKPPLTGVSRAKAAELCEQAGGRLCTELEWERACKGPEGTAFAGSAAWDAKCAKEPASCASGFGVLGMGAAYREWTASEVLPIEDMQPRAAAVRGARGSAVAPDHRCAHRTAIDPGASAEDLGFRCCRGAPNAATIPSPQWEQTYRRVELPAKELAEMLASVPALSTLDREITYFKEPDDVNVVLARGDAGAPPPNTVLTTSPLLWNPVPGEQIVVLAGRAAKDSFVVAFYRLPGDRYRIASTLVLKDEKGPIALGFNGYVRKRLFWATCWDCRGESGNVTYRDDGRVVITQK